jgi:hypothetical protein
VENETMARQESSPCSAAMQAALPLRINCIWYQEIRIFCSMCLAGQDRRLVICVEMGSFLFFNCAQIFLELINMMKLVFPPGIELEKAVLQHERMAMFE